MRDFEEEVDMAIWRWVYDNEDMWPEIEALEARSCGRVRIWFEQQ